MKTKLLLLTGGIALAAWTQSRGQEALKTDAAGRPLTPLNLSSPNVTGTLAADRLPPSAVQTVTATGGSVALANGTSVVLLANPLTEPLTLVLPAANGQGTGSRLVVVDPGGYSRAECAVQVAPSGQDTVDGAATAKAVLTGRGASTLWAGSDGRWTTDGVLREVNLLTVSPNPGMDMSPGATFSFDGRTIALGQGNNRQAELAVFDDSGQQAVRINGAGLLSSNQALTFDAPGEVHRVFFTGMNVQGNLSVDGSLSTDAGIIESDGAGTLYLGATICQGTHTLLPLDPARVQTLYTGGVTLYVSSADGKLHALDRDGVDHALW